MSKTNTLPITQNIKRCVQSFTSSDTTTFKTVYTAGANDAVVKQLNARTNDSTAVNLVVVINDGTTDRVIGTVNVPINSGSTGAIASVDLLGGTLIPSLPFDQNGKRVLPMQGGDILKIGCLATMTAAKTTDVTGFAEEY